MRKKLFKTFVALLLLTVAAAIPAWGQTTYNVTFSGFANNNKNITHEGQALPFQITFSRTDVANDAYELKATDFATSTGEDEIDVQKDDDNLYITISEPFDGTATINVQYFDNQEDEYNTNVYVTCVANAPAPATTYTVRFDESTDSTGWTVSPKPFTAGSTLTATYSGSKKVKSVTAVRDYGMLGEPLTIQALTNGTVVLQDFAGGVAPSFQYSVNGGDLQTYNVMGQTINVTAGDKIRFYGNSGCNYDVFRGTADVKAYGNIMSLIDANDFVNATTLTANDVFSMFFGNYAHLKDISGLVLPATTLTQNCYMSMFSNCTGLTTVPTDLLPATTLTRGCYYSMFEGCENLTNAPALPATTLAESCYRSMFFNCSALAAVPATLPATTLAERCYDGMFYGCSSLTTAPVLPAATLLYRSYADMFSGCSKLDSVVCMAITGINIEHSTDGWLDGAGTQAEGTKYFVANPYIFWPEGVNGVPAGWTRKNPDGSNWTIYDIPLTIEAIASGTVTVSNPEYGMQYSLNCAAKQSMVGNTDIPVQAGDKVFFFGNGTILNRYGNDDYEGSTRILCNNESKVYGNIMSLVNETGFATATTLPYEYHIFANLFYENTGLTDASLLLLPATSLREGCYKGMFSQCTELTNTPALPATTLANYCYAEMFSDCDNLVTAVPDTLRATTLAVGCYQSMFNNCDRLTTAPVLPALTLVDNCYASMFMDCPLLYSVTCLATDVSASGCTSNWLKQAGFMSTQDRTFTAATTTVWAEPSVSGIPSFNHDGWTRKNPDGTTFDYSNNLRSMVIDGVTIRYIPGETWAAALTNHSTENPGWNFIYGVGNDKVIYNDGNTDMILYYDGEGQVSTSEEITPDNTYTLDE